MQIPSWPQSDEREAELLRMVLENPQWGGFHPYIAQFEQSFASYQHAEHGIAAFNGTVTLELALQVLQIGPGDEVIVPAISFISSASAISRARATPVFVDIGPESYNLDPERIREAISPCTKAIMPVHFGGTMCDLDALQALSGEYSVPIIEDAAHAHGSEWRGRRAGSFGIAGSFSFQNGKVLCAGEGGLLVSSDDRFAEVARSVVNCGRVPGRSFYEHHRLGTNLRLTAFQAAVLLAQFERLPEQIKRRTENAYLLKQSLVDLDEIVWQEQAAQITQNSWYLLIGRLRQPEKRDEFVRRLTQLGVPCAPFYPHTLYQNPLYRQQLCRVMDCPVAEQRLKDAFWLPHRVLLSDRETMTKVAEAIRAALA